MEVEMDASGVHHHQEISAETLESMLVCRKGQQEKKARPAEEAQKCPRCDSTNTKFCYYNNYSLTQPRYFCKSCRRYWTKGGTLRNVPVGGGCRKNKRPSSSSATSSTSNSSSSKIRGTADHHHHHQYPLLSGLPPLPYHSTSTDLSLAFARLQSQSQVNTHLGFDQFDCSTPAHLGSFLGGFLDNGLPNVLYTGGNLGNGDMGCVENGGILMGSLTNCNLDQDNHEIMNPMLHHHQENVMNYSSNGAETTAVTVTTVKQESCHGRPEVGESRGGTGGGVLWGFPWQMGFGVGGGGDIQGSNWHGLLNSPLM